MLVLKFFLLCVITIETGVLCNTLCAFSKKDNVKYKREDASMDDETYAQHSIPGHIADPNNTEHCSKESDSCYALWQEDPVNKSIVIITQGCWDSSGDENCGSSECIAYKKPPKALNNSKFCCCSGNLCNLNVSDGYVSPPPDERNLNPALQYVEPMAYTSSTVVVISIAGMTVFIVLALVMYYLFRFYFHPPKRSKESLNLIESAAPQAPTFDVDSLKVQETIGRGRYGTVCRGSLNEHTVAVKIFGHQNRQYFLNERDIYLLPHMEHPSLLKYIGSEEKLGADGRPEYLLVLSYAPSGCLQDYLRENITDWTRLCKMSLSIARGLAHLHTEYGKSDKIKPCIAHRDLTSRNILIKTDGSCMLCDFGFAIRISGSKYFVNGEEQIAETTSLADVGTLRYMSPEILEGAVNLRDCESSLKQIDVYALGLVLWEIATRCSDLFQGVDVLEYKAPFEAEVGTHPTMEQMQILVARHKARPLFPDIWKDTNPAVRTLKETIEECWDQDAEARLTTLCVEERLAELPVLWERYKAGLGGLPYSSPINHTFSYGESTLSVKSQSSGEDMCENVNNGGVIQSIARDRTHSLSEGTIETLISPSEPGTKDVSADSTCKNGTANNVLVTSSKVSLPLQPHQGRNPVLERNLMMEPVDDIAVNGNTLVEHKTTSNVNFLSLSEGDVDILDTLAMDNSSLVSNDLLSHSTHICNKIPYHLNAVKKMDIVPKQPNIPGNGHTGRQNDFKSKERRWSPLKMFDRKKLKTKESIRSGLKSLLERKSCGNSSKELCEEQQPLKGTSATFCASTPLDVECSQSSVANNWTSEDEKTEQHIDTEVRVIKSDCCSTVVKPLNSTQNNEKVSGLEGFVRYCPNGTAADEPQTATLSEVKPTEKCKRPNSLPLCEYKNLNEETIIDHLDETMESQNHKKDGSLPILRKNSSGRRKGVKRVKTPFEIKGRFSLYDDRIMSSQELSAVYPKEAVPPVLCSTTKFSTSVPLDMNALCSQQPLVQKEKHVQANSDAKLRNGLKIHSNHFPVVESVCDI